MSQNTAKNNHTAIAASADVAGWRKMTEKTSASASQIPAYASVLSKKSSPRATSAPLGATPSTSNPMPVTSNHSASRLIPQRHDARQKLAQQQGVPVNGLRQDAAERAPVVLAVHRIESQGDGRQREKESQKGDERGKWILLRREELQVHERVFRDRGAQLARGHKRGRKRGQEDQQFQQLHTHAAEVVGEVFEDDRPQPGPGRPLTPHGPPSGSSGRRLHPGTGVPVPDPADPLPHSRPAGPPRRGSPPGFRVCTDPPAPSTGW